LPRQIHCDGPLPLCPETRGVKEDALACVKMAIAMRRKMTELQDILSESGIANPLRCRIGINTAFCTVGNFGSENRLDYTIIGSGVNLWKCDYKRDKSCTSNESQFAGEIGRGLQKRSCARRVHKFETR
jgi:hypothetical protein